MEREVQKIKLGNIKGEKGDPGPNTVSMETTTSGFEDGEFLFSTGGKLFGKNVLKLMMPVGYIFEWSPVMEQAIDLSTPEKMAAHFGFGTWAELGKGRVLVGVDASDPDFNTPNKMGGEKKHALTGPEGPEHRHKVRYVGNSANGIYGGMPGTSVDGVPAENDLVIAPAGEGKPHNNLQPYVAVYRWQRIK